MQKGKLNLYFDVNFPQPVVFLLEAPEEQDKWNRIFNTAYQLLKALPGRVNTVYFLGNRKAYNIALPDDFTRDSPGWYNENKGRVCLVNPIFDKLEKESLLIVVICSKLPVDIEDWNDSELLERTLFVTISDKPLGSSYNEIDSRCPTSSIVAALNNPVKEVYIKGNGFVPLCFELESKGKASVDYNENDGFVLKISAEEEKVQIHILAISTEFPKLYVKRNRGKEEIFEAKEENQWFSEPSWQEIDSLWQNIIDAGIKKESFTCPQCKKFHKFSTILCPEGDIILKNLPLGTCVLFKGKEWLPLSDLYAYPLKENKRVITKEGKLYDYENGIWKFKRDISPYEEVDNGMWGLFHTT